MHNIHKTKLSQLAFLLLFAAEFTYYLLILQTGVVVYHHSLISEIWMVPFGGILGIVLSIRLHKEREWLIPVLLLFQLLLSFHYAQANTLELFALGLISGLTAPMLIYRIDRFWLVVVALGLSYTYGTYYFSIPAFQRTNIALFLSFIALSASLFSNINLSKIKKETITLYDAGSIFLWLLLDAALFELLSRDATMHLWGESSYTWIIILFHCLGLFTAYKARDWKHNNSMLILLFFITYSCYTSGWQLALSVVYPFVISYYNVTILRKLMQLPYTLLAIMALSLWGASGLGLIVALSNSFGIAWGILLLLVLMETQTIFPLTLWRIFENIWDAHIKFLLRFL